MKIILHQTIFLGLTVLGAAFSQTNDLAQNDNSTHNQPMYAISVDERNLFTNTRTTPPNAHSEMGRLYEKLQATVKKIRMATKKEEIDVDDAIDVVDKAIDSLISVRAELRDRRRGRRNNQTRHNIDSSRPVTSSWGNESLSQNEAQSSRNSSVPVPTSSMSFSNSGGDITSTPSSVSQTNLHGSLTSQLPNTTLGVIEQSIESKRRNDEERHRVQQEFYRRQHQGKLLDLEHKKNESLRNVQITNETEYIRHQHELSNINEQIEEGRRQTESQIKYIQRMEELAELKHQDFLKELERQRQDREQRKKNSRCSGQQKLNPSCWG